MAGRLDRRFESRSSSMGLTDVALDGCRPGHTLLEATSDLERLMMEFSFTLMYRVPDTGEDPSAFERCLAESGCDDALLGSGLPGILALRFQREGKVANDVVRDTCMQVQNSLPAAELITVHFNVSNVASNSTCGASRAGLV
ncbi:hypothetical protein [Stenotrophomonas maltophilia]|uniref:hypothetical protein n=1 Tax=Stenotrophomonas maltophilia TaxID=40324 RepID=UPI0013DD3F68|nr:hypothetical protein [Stenotrophomonas maltophilia]